jgi:hypothetical protein
MIDRLQAGNWLVLGTITFGCIAVFSAWQHEFAEAILFGIAAALCSLATSLSSRRTHP